MVQLMGSITFQEKEIKIEFIQSTVLSELGDLEFGLMDLKTF